jgi:hypothetical protein
VALGAVEPLLAAAGAYLHLGVQNVFAHLFDNSNLIIYYYTANLFGVTPCMACPTTLLYAVVDV